MNVRKLGSAALLAGLLLCQRGYAWNVLPEIGFPKGFSGMPLSVSVDDFNNDGRKDVLMTMEPGATSATYAGTVMLFSQQANGQLVGPYVAYRGTPAVDHEAADLNHDGRTDLVVAHGFGVTTMIAQPGGGFVRATYDLPADRPGWHNAGWNNLVLYDVDRDGQRDIVMFAWYGYAAAYLLNPNGTVRSSHGFRVPTAGYNDFALGDVDHDGKEDLVSSSGQGLNEQLVVYGPDGLGGLAVRASWTNGYDAPNSIAVGDFDHDGLQEILFTVGRNSPAFMSRMLLDPDLNIVAFDSLDADQVPAGLVAGDINGDGLDDAALYNNGWYGLGVFLQSEGRLLPMNQFSIKSNTWDPDALAIGDVTGDGCPDLVMGDYDGTYLLQVVRGTACNVSPLPTVDYGMVLHAWPVKPIADLPGGYDRYFTATLNVYSGDQLKIKEPTVYIRLTALAGYKVKIAGTATQWDACSIAESTETSALVVCSDQFWTTQRYSPRRDFSVALDPLTDTKVRIDTWVESGGASRREIHDTNPRNQSVTKIVSFIGGQGAPPPCERDPLTHLCKRPSLQPTLAPTPLRPARR
jgi:hypothetical protein